MNVQRGLASPFEKLKKWFKINSVVFNEAELPSLNQGDQFATITEVEIPQAQEILRGNR